jgi:FAD/FMN-containing dehydrogenase/Fe-S oxidoreductase
MEEPLTEVLLVELQQQLKGTVITDTTSRILFSTDASAYAERPLGVVFPKDARDVELIVRFCYEHAIPLIPRAAGTSLAGQVVGHGLVVDVSRYMTRILEFNKEERWVKVQPGVVLDELNLFLEKDGLFFGPETSTSNRCMIGGMVGNNSCGAHSILYGSTRDHTLSLKGFLSNGEQVLFKALQNWEWEKKCQEESMEGAIYRKMRDVLGADQNREAIRKDFPHPEIHRRNTGYALDLLLDAAPFNEDGEPFNMCRLLAGSEGTLFFSTEITLNLVPLPPREKGLICVHLDSLEDAFKANLVALEYQPGAIELMDKLVMDLTKDNLTQAKNRFFVQGDPKALLLVEFARNTRDEILQIAERMEEAMRKQGYGYAFPVLFGKDIGRVWALRKAGLGVLSNMPGDDLPVPVIEDTAVRPQELPAFMEDVLAMLKGYGKECVCYAHIGSGELHLRPVLNMKRAEDVQLFHDIARDTAVLVRKYRGSLSGEHGDGRLRGQFIAYMVGDHNYNLFKEIKLVFDPRNILNPGKIVDTPPMNSSLRYASNKGLQLEQTVFDWSHTQGFVRAVEKCNGSGDCRKSHVIGGTMCPSYMGSKQERNTTRARANILRAFLHGTSPVDRLGYEEVKQVLDLCLSCKACQSECPSSVDMTKLKAEFLHHYHKQYGLGFRSWIIGHLPIFNHYLMPIAGLVNGCFRSRLMSNVINRLFSFSLKRQLPLLSPVSLKKWIGKKCTGAATDAPKVYLLADEFTNFNDADVGVKAILLLEKLGYQVVIPKHVNSGRTYLSKGMLKRAKSLALKNVRLLAPIVSECEPLIGIEPSAILTFRDEYPKLVPKEWQKNALQLAASCFSFEEFMCREADAGRINPSAFTEEERELKFHAHCFQKALSETSFTKRSLEIPKNFKATEIPSGCCGMAGSFGYEKEHYDLSMKIGELVLFPAVRQMDEKILLVAAGTSCRHQIKDGTSRQAIHPAQILYDALV